MALLNDDMEEYREEGDRVLMELLKSKLYSEARLFVEVAKLDSQDITIHQVAHWSY